MDGHLVPDQSPRGRLLPNAMHITTSELATFSSAGVAHRDCDPSDHVLLVGLLYGAMLPSSRGDRFLLGGFVAPVFWSALLHGILTSSIRSCSDGIDGSGSFCHRFAFGVVAGLVVSR